MELTYHRYTPKKKGPTAKLRARKRAKKTQRESVVKCLVRIRDHHRCRVCNRPSQSVHEIKAKGAGGEVSLQNSIAVCGRLVGVEPSCHTYLQAYVVRVTPAVGSTDIDANEHILFATDDDHARLWILGGME